MAIGTATAILASSAIGAGVSMSAGRSQANAARRAGDQAYDASQQSMQLQREQYDQARRQLTPYVQEGDAARRMLNGALGLPFSPSAQPTQGGFPGAAGYVPQGMAQYQPQGAPGQGFGDFASVGDDWVRQSYGGEMQQLQAETGQQMMADPIADARADFYSAYEQTPYAEAARTAQRRASNALMGAFGANGVSGKAQRAGQENLRQANLGGQQQYMNMLMGVSDTGFSASSGIASGGANYANNAGNALMRGAEASGNARMMGAEYSAQGLNNAAGFAGWGLGQYQPGPAQFQSAGLVAPQQMTPAATPFVAQPLRMPNPIPLPSVLGRF